QVPGRSFDEPTVVGSTLRTVDTFYLAPAAVGGAVGIAAGLILLIVLPSRLLDSTLRSNYQHVFRWLDSLFARSNRLTDAMARSRWLRWGVTGATLLGSAIVLGFTDPGFGFNEASMRLTIALTVSIIALGLVRGWATGALARRWWDVEWTYRLRPGGILLLFLGVLATRLIGLEPGIILGVWLGASLARYLGQQREAHLVLVTTGMVTALGLVSWVGYSLITPLAAAEPGFGILLAQEILSTLTLKSLATFVVLLLPLTYLDGKTLWDWSRAGWLVTYAALATVFALVVLPLPGQWSDLRTPPAVLIAVFGAFAIVSIATWAFFRRRSKATPPKPVSTGSGRA
ncbi:MAG TPA: hypothetical protein PK890_11150, partial [Terrimesophilobacter sp.]|nr:hypothetical protein [Terrimesophilobacter sp.]